MHRCAVILLLSTVSWAQLPPEAVMLDKVKIPETIKSHELDPVTLESADPALGTWEHEGVQYGASTADTEATFLANPETYIAAHDAARWELNFCQAMSIIWCPVTDEIAPGGNTVWEEIGYTWESCCQFCDDTKTDADFPPALERLKARAAKSYELLGGALYTEGASSPVEGAIDFAMATGGTEPEHEGSATKNDQYADAKAIWTGGVGALFVQRCIECHRDGGSAPMAFTTYRGVRKWTKNMKSQIEQGNMPPWPASNKHAFANSKALTRHEKELMLDWIADGYPKGNGEFASAALTGEWRIGAPDLVLVMPPYIMADEVGAHVRTFEFTPDISSDQWVVASEIHPTNDYLILSVQAGPLGAYTTGNSVIELPEGYAFFLKAGDPVTIRVFYTKETGWEETDNATRIALKFADNPDSITHEVRSFRIASESLSIPAGESAYEAGANHIIKSDARLLAVTPIMRERGKSLWFEVNGEDVLDIPRWMPEWKFTYFLEQPLDITAPASLGIRGIFDNSAMNAANPDPSVDASAADHSEIIEAWILYAVPRE